MDGVSDSHLLNDSQEPSKISTGRLAFIIQYRKLISIHVYNRAIDNNPPKKTYLRHSNTILLSKNTLFSTMTGSTSSSKTINNKYAAGVIRKKGGRPVKKKLETGAEGKTNG